MADDDDLTKSLVALTGELPVGRVDLSEADKDALVAKLGPRTVASIQKAKRELPLKRIPFLFSSLDGQAVADVLANDMSEAVARALSDRR